MKIKIDNKVCISLNVEFGKSDLVHIGFEVFSLPVCFLSQVLNLLHLFHDR